MPYITIHAQRKSRAIWRLINSIDLHENLFLDSAGENGGSENGGKLDVKDNVRSVKDDDDDDIVDSDDEMDDEGEEFDVNLMGGDGEGRNGVNTSLVCILILLLSANFHLSFILGTTMLIKIVDSPPPFVVLHLSLFSSTPTTIVKIQQRQQR